MEIVMKPYERGDLDEALRIWNQVVEEGVAFPQEEYLTRETGQEFFAAQTYCAVAAEPSTGKVHGLYILHPNNVGRCGHIANASYAVSRESRGRRIGAQMVADSLTRGKALGFRILQFNAVVSNNTRARRLYRRLGFCEVGCIPGGFRMRDGHFEDIVVYYHLL